MFIPDPNAIIVASRKRYGERFMRMSLGEWDMLQEPFSKPSAHTFARAAASLGYRFPDDATIVLAGYSPNDQAWRAIVFSEAFDEVPVGTAAPVYPVDWMEREYAVA